MIWIIIFIIGFIMYQTTKSKTKTKSKSEILPIPNTTEEVWELFRNVMNNKIAVTVQILNDQDIRLFVLSYESKHLCFAYNIESTIGYCDHYKGKIKMFDCDKTVSFKTSKVLTDQVETQIRKFLGIYDIIIRSFDNTISNEDFYSYLVHFRGSLTKNRILLDIDNFDTLFGYKLITYSLYANYILQDKLISEKFKQTNNRQSFREKTTKKKPDINDNNPKYQKYLVLLDNWYKRKEDLKKYKKDSEDWKLLATENNSVASRIKEMEKKYNFKNPRV